MGMKPRPRPMYEHPIEGLHSNRYSREPLEKRFAEFWAKENAKDMRSPLLEYLLSTGNQTTGVSERDWIVANTVIQWLGSTVGQSFLEEVMQYRMGED